jgi:hypothetical protein
MPYYYKLRESEQNNRDGLKELLEEAGAEYCDLFELFENENEILYHKQDSHWNNKGALMVYNAVLSALEKDHESL